MARHVLVVDAEGDLLEEVRARLAREGLPVELDDGERQRRFMKDLAHELSTPLTPIAGYLRILESGKLGQLSAQQRRVVESTLVSLARLTRIVQNLSDFATLAPGDARLHLSPLDPDQLAGEVVAEQEGAARDARLHVAVSPAGGGPAVADPQKLRQALGNLLSNAVKFSPHGGEVLVEVSRPEGLLRIAVWDQGPGVPSGELEAIFEPLHRAGRRGGEEARAPGSGLGLSVARRIAEAHGGRAFVESPPRNQPAGAVRTFGGSRFVLEIPLPDGAEGQG
jgi:signal transduction histidine kinase